MQVIRTPRFRQNPAKIHNYLTGIRYPARKNELIATAQRNEAPTRILRELHRIPDQRFQSPTELTEAVAHGHH